MDLAGLEWSTGSGSRRCRKEQSRGRHGGEDGAARWGRNVSEVKAGARGDTRCGTGRSGPPGSWAEGRVAREAAARVRGAAGPRRQAG